MATRKQVLAPVGTFVVIVAVAVTAALLNGGDGAPRTLHLAGTADKQAAAISSLGGGDYQLTGTLPAGKPADAPVWDLTSGPADADLVARLAKALHAPSPVRDGRGWRAGGLVVSGDAGQSWYFSSCGPDGVVSSAGPVGCAVTAPSAGSDGAPGSVPGSSGSAGTGSAGTGSSGSGSSGTLVTPAPVATARPAPEPSPVPETVVREAARPVYAALGLDVDRATVVSGPYGGSAALSPRVGGLETSGPTTRVDIDAKGAVQNASGWLADATKGDTYPLVTAQQAFDALPALPRALMCPISPNGKGCLEPPPIEITGAHLGLSLQPLAAGGQILVPAWLFDVKGSTDPVAGVAVEPRFLASDQPTARPTVGPSTGPSDNPGSPTQVEPPAPARSPLSFDSAYRAKTPNAVVVQYGDSSSCPHQNVTHAVKESATSVVVVLEADPMNTLVACTDNYLAKKVEVALQAPLGDRKVIDGTSGREIALS